MRVESLGHALFDYGKSWDFWLISLFFALCLEVRLLKFDKVIQWAKDKLGRNDFEIFFICLWAVCFLSNSMVMEENDSEYPLVMPTCYDWVVDYV